MTSWGLVEPWNPYVAVLPFLAYVICAWGAANGDRASLIAAVTAGSWCAQAHLGFVPLTLAVAVLALGWRVGPSSTGVIGGPPGWWPCRWC
ncbi:MAG TPA: hypothetical protein VGJ86_06340 [Acidimicrobiales bacterium]